VDRWNRFTIGSAIVKISQEKALQIADQSVQNQNYYNYGFVIGSNLEMIDSSVTSTLSFQPIGQVTGVGSGTLFPCWQVYGNVSFVEDTGTARIAPVYVEIRADTDYGHVQELQFYKAF
jgi:hypothetical protein